MCHGFDALHGQPIIFNKIFCIKGLYFTEISGAKSQKLWSVSFIKGLNIDLKLPDMVFRGRK